MATPPHTTLSYPPIPGPIAGDLMTNAPWVQWFRELWNRVGGPEALTNTELQTLIVQQTPGPPGPPGGGTGQDVSDPFLSGALSAVTDAQATTLALHTLHKRLDDLETLVLANQPPPAAAVPLSTMTALWNWSTVDGTGDPGAPNAAFDVAAAPLNLRVARRTLDNRDASAILATVQPGDVWTIESPTVSTIWMRFEVTAALAHFPTYFTFPGALLASGAGGAPAANMPVTLTVTRLAGLEDAGSSDETPWIRTAIDLDSRVQALENQPPEAIAQSVALALQRLEDLEQLVMMNVSPPIPPGVAFVGAVNQFTQPQIINPANVPVPVVAQGPDLIMNGSSAAGGTGTLAFVASAYQGAPAFIFTRAQGTPALPTAPTTQPLFTINGRGYDGQVAPGPYNVNAAQMSFNANEPGGFDATHHASSMRFLVTPQGGGTTLIEALHIHSSGCVVLDNVASTTLADTGGGTVNTRNGSYVNGNQALSLATGNDLALGNTGATTRIRSSLAAISPGLSPANGDWWVECTGTSPARVCALKVYDGGAARTIASFTY